MAVSASPSVVIDRLRCAQVADLLRRMQLPKPQEQSELPLLPAEVLGNFFFALVAICHQTSPVGGPALQGEVSGRHWRGWEYLFAKFEDASQKNIDLLSPRNWKSLTGSDIQLLFRDSESGDLLTEPNERAKLLNDLGCRMVAKGWESVDAIYRLCRGIISLGEPNLLATLSQFRAYNDPVHKKSIFFLSLMSTSGLWRYQDPQTLGTPVDYHEVRGHLRVGTVRIEDPVLKSKLLHHDPVDFDDDIAIRQSVYDAIMLISELSGLRNPTQLHYFFWHIFRTLCTRNNPDCCAANIAKLPGQYRNSAREGCPLAKHCDSRGMSHPITEHVYYTDYY